jgi:hypothetical protein
LDLFAILLLLVFRLLICLLLKSPITTRLMFPTATSETLPSPLLFGARLALTLARPLDSAFPRIAHSYKLILRAAKGLVVTRKCEVIVPIAPPPSYGSYAPLCLHDLTYTELFY